MTWTENLGIISKGDHLPGKVKTDLQQNVGSGHIESPGDYVFQN